MLFIGKAGESSLHDILSATDGKPIVTVSDIDNFAQRGGMFGLYNKDGNLAVELNLKRAKSNNVNLNSVLHGMVNIID